MNDSADACNVEIRRNLSLAAAAALLCCQNISRSKRLVRSATHSCKWRFEEEDSGSEGCSKCCCLRQKAPLPELLVKPRRLGQGRCQNAAQEQPFPGDGVFLVPLLASVRFLACNFASQVTLQPLTRPLTSPFTRPHTSVEAVPRCVVCSWRRRDADFAETSC